MYLKLSLKELRLIFLFIAIISLSACSKNSSTKIEFSFNTSHPANSSDERTIYINNDMDKLELNAELEIDLGSATIQVLSVFGDEVFWSGDYTEDTDFTIELTDIKASSEYLLRVEATQSSKVDLVVTSDNKLVKDREAPEKYIIEKK